MGRPKTNFRNRNVMLRVTDEQKAKLDRVAKASKTSVTALCRNIVDVSLGLSEDTLKRMNIAIRDGEEMLAKMQGIIEDQRARYQALREEYKDLRAKQTAVEVRKAQREVSVS